MAGPSVCRGLEWEPGRSRVRRPLGDVQPPAVRQGAWTRDGPVAIVVNVVLVLLGVLLLYAGGEVLVRNAALLARATGMSPLTVGLTVVALATSCPELATTLAANIGGSPDAALGNVVGSNIANLGLVLGLAALLSPLRSQTRLLRRELPFMILTAALLFLLLADGELGALEAISLLALLGSYLLVVARGGEHTDADEPQEGAGRSRPWMTMLGVVLGACLLVAGAQALIEGAIDLARDLGVTERLIGLTLVAVGGGLPELAGSVVAAIRRQGDIILGNLIGSNVFNLLFALSIAALARPLEIDPAAFRLDLWVMLGMSLLVLPFLATGRRLGRREGLVLLGVYTVYIALLFA